MTAHSMASGGRNIMSDSQQANRMTTAKQQRFIDEYLIDFNATQAAIRAGYSSDTAKQQGSRLLSNVDIRQAIQAAELSAQQRNAITFDDLLSELEDARQLAAGQGQASAMVSATMAKAKMLGFDKPQQQPSEAIQNIRIIRPTRIELVAPPAKDLTDEELAAELAKLGEHPSMMN